MLKRIFILFILCLICGRIYGQDLPVEETIEVPELEIVEEETEALPETNSEEAVTDQTVTQIQTPLSILTSTLTNMAHENEDSAVEEDDEQEYEVAYTGETEEENFFQSFRNMFVERTFLARLILSIGAILFIWLLRFFILKIVFRNTEKVNLRYRWRKISSYVGLGLGIILVSQIWIEQFDSILTYLGLVSAGIAIALKDFFINLLGWLFIIWTKPFEVGDRIELEEEEIAGDVIDIRAFQFIILEIGNWVDADQSTGRILHIPNGKVFNQSLANYSKAFQYIWNELNVIVTFQSDWKRARAVLLEIVKEKAEGIITHVEKKIKEASRRFMISYTDLTPIVYTRVKDSGIELTIRYLCDPKKRRTTENELWENILEAFEKESNVEFAYTTYTIHPVKEDPVHTHTKPTKTPKKGT